MTTTTAHAPTTSAPQDVPSIKLQTVHIAADPHAVLRDAYAHALDRTERLVLLLWYAERLNPREIAAALDLTEHRVRALHDRIISAIRDSLVAA